MLQTMSSSGSLQLAQLDMVEEPGRAEDSAFVGSGRFFLSFLFGGMSSRANGRQESKLRNSGGGEDSGKLERVKGDGSVCNVGLWGFTCELKITAKNLMDHPIFTITYF